MTLSSEKTEEKTRPGPSELFPLDISDRAPTDQGINKLMTWVSDNLSGIVEKEVNKRKDFVPIDSLDSMTSDALEHLYKDHAHTRTKVLWRYINYSYMILLAKDPEARERFARRSDKMPEKLRKKLSTTPEQLRQRQIGVETVISVLGLSREKEILDDLFERAAAIEIQTEPVIEGKLLSQ